MDHWLAEPLCRVGYIFTCLEVEAFVSGWQATIIALVIAVPCVFIVSYALYRTIHLLK